MNLNSGHNIVACLNSQAIIFMNILLFKQEDIIEQSENRNIIHIQGERFTHLRSRKFKLNDSLRVGELNGLCGQGTITKLDKDFLEIEYQLISKPPQAAAAKLILALPRPIMLKRLLVDIAMLGIKDIVLLATNKVEKSFWSSQLLKEDNIKNYLLKGLEQSCDTVLPTVTLENKFLPFVEDKLADYAVGKIILAHPMATEICPQPASEPFTLIVGPESGFTEYEVDKFIKNGARAVTIGERHLRVETAATYLLGRLL